MKMKENRSCILLMIICIIISASGQLMISDSFFSCLVSFSSLAVFLVYILMQSKNILKDTLTIITFVCYSVIAFGVSIISLINYGIEMSYGKVSFLLGLMISYSIFLYWYGTYVKKWTLEKRFLIIGIPYGVFMMVNMPIRIVPDEITHMLTSYKNANIIIGIDSADTEKITLRTTDADFLVDNIEYACDYAMMNRYYDRYYDSVSEEITLVDSSNALSQNDISHIISAIPIALCKKMNINGFWTWMSGRCINLMVYVVAVYFAIKMIPFGKRIPFTIALLPMSMQQAMSYSYDSWIIAASIYVVSVSLGLIYSNLMKQNRVYFLICLAFAFSLIAMKSHAYFLIGLFPIFLWIEKNMDTTIFWKWFWRMCGLIGIIFLIYIGFDVLFGVPDIIRVPDNPIGWMNGEQGYTWQYLINNPVQTVLVALRTIKNQSIMYITTMISNGLGWLNINLSVMVFVVYCFMLLFSVSGNDSIRMKKGMKYWMIVIVLITTLGIFYAHMVNWTVVSCPIVLGVQGRYFIPLLIIICLFFNINWKHTKQLHFVWDHMILFGYVMVAIELIGRF